MNRLCIEMTPTQRRRDAKRRRKGVLRKMKCLLRIIGERPVPHAEKILSVDEPDVQILVRGKASGEVEFGHTLMISETRSGLITDWQLYQKRAPAEWRQFEASLLRQNQFDLSTPIEGPRLRQSLPRGGLERPRPQSMADRPTARRPTPTGPSRVKPKRPQ